MNASEIIRNIMIDNNLSQMQLAKTLGVSQKAISNWLNGIDKPNASSLLIIYKNFGITPNDMLEIEIAKDDNTVLQYSNKEQQLIRAYRQMSEEKKQALFKMLDIK